MNKSLNRRSLYKIGGVAAWIVSVLTLSEIIFFVLYPPPETVSGWFELFQTNALVAILDFWGLEIPMYVMFIFVFLALYALLKDTGPSLMTISLIFIIVGNAIFLSTNNPFSMLTLSNQYVAATTDSERSALLAAGQVLVSNTNQRAVGGFNIGLFLVSIAGLLTSKVMLQSRAFSKSTAIIGILAFAFSLADYIRQVFTQSLLVTLPLILLGALFLLTWFVSVGVRLFRLGSITENIQKENN